MTGHLLGAAGAVEAIACVGAITEGFVPPTVNYLEPDPECDLDYVANEGRKMEVRRAMSNSFGFGGHNCCIVLPDGNRQNRMNRTEAKEMGETGQLRSLDDALALLPPIKTHLYLLTRSSIWSPESRL